MRKLKGIFTVATCLLMWAVLLSGWTHTYDIATPLGSDAPSVLDDRDREAKAAVQERQNVDHYWPLTGTEVSAADAGKHRYVTFREPNDLTTMSADESALFSKDVNSLTEFHWIDESDNVLQITSGGQLYVVTASIADANVTLALMADDSIDSDQYVDGSIDTAHIADANVTTAKIADDTILPADVNNIFGTWTNKDSGGSVALAKDSVYQAGSDGFVIAYAESVGNSATLYGYTDGNATPTTKRASQRAGTAYFENVSFYICMPVKKDDYWKFTSSETPTIYWLPIGSGTCVKQ